MSVERLFFIDMDPAVLADLKTRLSLTRWTDAVTVDRSFGTDRAFLQQLIEHRRDPYDRSQREAMLNHILCFRMGRSAVECRSLTPGERFQNSTRRASTVFSSAASFMTRRIDDVPATCANALVARGSLQFVIAAAICIQAAQGIFDVSLPLRAESAGLSATRVRLDGSCACGRLSSPAPPSPQSL